MLGKSKQQGILINFLSMVAMILFYFSYLNFGSKYKKKVFEKINSKDETRKKEFINDTLNTHYRFFCFGFWYGFCILS